MFMWLQPGVKTWNNCWMSAGSCRKLGFSGHSLSVGETRLSSPKILGHLLDPMLPELRDDSAFMDRMRLLAWLRRAEDRQGAAHIQFGLVSDFLSQCWTQLSNRSQISLLQNRVFFGGALSGRDANTVNKIVSDLIKALYLTGLSKENLDDPFGGLRLLEFVRFSSATKPSTSSLAHHL
jgi:hypothetical protein